MPTNGQPMPLQHCQKTKTPESSYQSWKEKQFGCMHAAKCACKQTLVLLGTK
jgi:hypothetical protein